jgi:hypothetical protein
VPYRATLNPNSQSPLTAVHPLAVRPPYLVSNQRAGAGYSNQPRLIQRRHSGKTTSTHPYRHMDPFPPREWNQEWKRGTSQFINSVQLSLSRAPITHNCTTPMDDAGPPKVHMLDDLEAAAAAMVPTRESFCSHYHSTGHYRSPS